MKKNRKTNDTQCAKEDQPTPPSSGSKRRLQQRLTREEYQAFAHETLARRLHLMALEASVKAARRRLKTSVAVLESMTREIYRGVQAKFGPDSQNYATGSGARTSARKRATRRPDDGGPGESDASTAPTS